MVLVLFPTEYSSLVENYTRLVENDHFTPRLCKMVIFHQSKERYKY